MARRQPLLTARDVLSMAVGKTPANMKYDKNKDGKITSADALAYSKTAKGKIAERRQVKAQEKEQIRQGQLARQGAMQNEYQRATQRPLAQQGAMQRARAAMPAPVAPQRPPMMQPPMGQPTRGMQAPMGRPPAGAMPPAGRGRPGVFKKGGLVKKAAAKKGAAKKAMPKKMAKKGRK
jgi:hypothetical protein